MDWDQYKEQCHRPDIWTRWMLEQTLELLPARCALARPLRLALGGAPLAKPLGHQGGAWTDMFRLQIDRALVQAIISTVEQAAARGDETSGAPGRGLSGFVEAWRELDQFITITEEALVNEARDVVLAMIDGFNRIDLDAILECFTEDAIYHNIPMQAVRGREGIRGVLAGFLAPAQEVQWDVLNLAVDGDVVLTERVDKFKVNGTWVEIPVMGVFELIEGRIGAWRDYFDLGQVQTGFGAAGVGDGSADA